MLLDLSIDKNKILNYLFLVEELLISDIILKVPNDVENVEDFCVTVNNEIYTINMVKQISAGLVTLVSTLESDSADISKLRVLFNEDEENKKSSVEILSDKIEILLDLVNAGLNNTDADEDVNTADNADNDSMEVLKGMIKDLPDMFIRKLKDYDAERRVENLKKARAATQKRCDVPLDTIVKAYCTANFKVTGIVCEQVGLSAPTVSKRLRERGLWREPHKCIEYLSERGIAY